MCRGGWDVHALGLTQIQTQPMEKRGAFGCAHRRQWQERTESFQAGSDPRPPLILPCRTAAGHCLMVASLHPPAHFISLLRWGPTAHGHTVGMLSPSWRRDRGCCRSSSSWTCCPLSLHPLPWGPGLSRAPAPPALGSGSVLGPCILCPGLRLLLLGPS